MYRDSAIVHRDRPQLGRRAQTVCVSTEAPLRVIMYVAGVEMNEEVIQIVERLQEVAHTLCLCIRFLTPPTPSFPAAPTPFQPSRSKASTKLSSASTGSADTSGNRTRNRRKEGAVRLHILNLTHDWSEGLRKIERLNQFSWPCPCVLSLVILGEYAPCSRGMT